MLTDGCGLFFFDSFDQDLFCQNSSYHLMAPPFLGQQQTFFLSPRSLSRISQGGRTTLARPASPALSPPLPRNMSSYSSSFHSPVHFWIGPSNWPQSCPVWPPFLKTGKPHATPLLLSLPFQNTARVRTSLHSLHRAGCRLSSPIQGSLVTAVLPFVTS